MGLILVDSCEMAGLCVRASVFFVCLFVFFFFRGVGVVGDEPCSLLSTSQDHFDCKSKSAFCADVSGCR